MDVLPRAFQTVLSGRGKTSFSFLTVRNGRGKTSLDFLTVPSGRGKTSVTAKANSLVTRRGPRHCFVSTISIILDSVPSGATRQLSMRTVPSSWKVVLPLSFTFSPVIGSV